MYSLQFKEDKNTKAAPPNIPSNNTQVSNRAQTDSDIKIPQSATSVKSQQSTKGSALDALRKQYGEIEPGENPTREARVPRKTEKHKNVSQTVRTIIEAGVTPDVVLPDIERMIANGDFSREAYGDDVAINKARNKLKYDKTPKFIKTAFRNKSEGC